MPAQPDNAFSGADLHQKECKPRREIALDSIRDHLPAGIDDFYIAAFVVLNRNVNPGVLFDSRKEVAKRIVGCHTGIVSQTEFVTADIGLNDGRVVTDDFDEQHTYARGLAGFS